MRSLVVCALAVVFWLVPVFASSLPAWPVSSQLTVLLDFEHPHSVASVSAMQKEVETILQTAGLRIGWKLLADVRADHHFEDLVVVKMHGSCEMQAQAMVIDERGPLAFTHSSDGQVLPFSEVACDRVRALIQPVMHGGDHGRSTMLFGRALGRVLAHEMYHILGRTHHHGADGVAKTCLSGKQLLADKLAMAEVDLHVIRRNRRPAFQ